MIKWTENEMRQYFYKKRVALVGSGPSVLSNETGLIDSYDVVVRVSNYRTRHMERFTGKRTDVHYSFYGSSIKKNVDELKADGVKFCMSKCPDAFCFKHEYKHDKCNTGGDFRWIYKAREKWWFCPTYITSVPLFMEQFTLLGGHVPTTGFSAIYDLMKCTLSEMYITGFDFMTSKIHNVFDHWDDTKNTDDPVRHVPAVELEYVRKMFSEKHYGVLKCDGTLYNLINATTNN